MIWNQLPVRNVLLLCVLWLPAQSWSMIGVEHQPAGAIGGFGSAGNLPLFRGADPEQMMKSQVISDLVDGMTVTPETHGILLPPDDSDTISSGSVPARQEQEPKSLLQKPWPEFWEEEREKRQELLQVLEEQDVSEFELRDRDDVSQQVIEILHRDRQETASVPEPPADPDDFKGQQVYRQQQAAAFRERDEGDLEPAFARDQDESIGDGEMVAEANRYNGDVELDTRHVYKGAVNGMVHLPDQNSQSSKTPSAPPSDAPPSYQEAVENGGYVPWAVEPRLTWVIRNGQLVQEPTLPIASSVGQVREVNPWVRRNGVKQLPESTRELGLLGKSQAAVIEAASSLKIPVGITSKLSRLREYHIYLIVDDSGSMGESDTGLSYEKNGCPQLSRMEELKFRLRAIIPLLAAVSVQGITIRCLNRFEAQYISGDMSVRDKEAALRTFVDSLQPSYGTPLNQALKDSFENAKSQQRPTVVYIFTDGEPTDYAAGASGSQGFINLIRQIRRERDAEFFPIGLMPCTDKKSCIQWMNGLDEDTDLGWIQVVDDYFSERKEVYDHHGGLIPYTIGLYLAAALLGPVDQVLDNLDESTIFTKRQLEEFMGYRVSSEEYQRYRSSAQEAVRNRHMWGHGRHPVDWLNREPIYLQGQALFRIDSGCRYSDSDDNDPDPYNPNECPLCTIL
ncbi:hypothetical protein GZ77_25325 [Endozoicomonas montiporae]|uniref:VWFA domain-containing protein n=3 Tax=Endozoicomonas montiporae TaxID=1027273 RepID=A0A081MZ05_9GAMM|nr:hypothetical protein EZMO1_0661 [Endozoicomonas montiporae CL-33]KEQ11428.1 hypothetical protein GZ77_25325 [Endozoicomonas montiporae]